VRVTKFDRQGDLDAPQCGYISLFAIIAAHTRRI